MPKNQDVLWQNFYKKEAAKIKIQKYMRRQKMYGQDKKGKDTISGGVAWR